MKHKQKYLRLIVFLAILIGLLAFSTSAAEELTESAAGIIGSGKCGANLTWTLYDTNELTISGSGGMYNYGSDTVPWYSFRSTIFKINLGSSVTTIGDYAFTDTNIESISLPNNLNYIGDNAFENCNSLSEISIPSTVTKIGSYAFHGCEKLLYATLPDGLTEIPDHCFASCIQLVNCSIPDSVTTIGNSAFWGCMRLNAIDFPSGLTTLKDAAFVNCINLTEISLPMYLTEIEDNVFSQCWKLSKVTFSNSITKIGDHSFFETVLTDVYFYGTRPEWNEIFIHDPEDFANATIHYRSNAILISEKDGFVTAKFIGTPLAYGLIFHTGDETYDLNTPGILQVAYTGLSANKTITYLASEEEKMMPLRQCRAYAIYPPSKIGGTSITVYSNIVYTSYNKCA